MFVLSPNPIHELRPLPFEIGGEPGIEFGSKLFPAEDAVVGIRPGGIVRPILLEHTAQRAVIQRKAEQRLHHAAPGTQIVVHPTAAKQDAIE